MEEREFLKEGGLLVTSSRIQIDGQTFATRNVGSVKVVAPGVSFAAGLLAIVGALMLATSAWLVGIIIVVVGVLWVYGSSRRRELRLMAGGGEVLALRTYNSGLAERVSDAIAAAISVR